MCYQFQALKLQNTQETSGEREATDVDGTDMKVSVIIPSLNLGRFVEQTLDSVLMQDYQNLEIIVVDGVSTDNTLSTLSRYPSIHLYSQPDRGIVEALQRGVERSTGDLIMFMMISDGYLDSSWISKCVTLLRSHPSTSLCFGLPRYMSEDGVLGEISYERWLTNPPVSQVAIFEHWLTTGWHFPECNMCVRKQIVCKVFETIDPLDDSIDVFLEFTSQFHTSGYLASFLPVVANFGRLHFGQRGQNERQSGILRKRQLLYHRTRNALVKDLCLRRSTFIFRSADGCAIELYDPPHCGTMILGGRFVVSLIRRKVLSLAMIALDNMRNSRVRRLVKKLRLPSRSKVAR